MSAGFGQSRVVYTDAMHTPSEIEQTANRNKDAVALVTGASAGIGAAVAQALLHQGFRVAACARRLDKLTEVLKEADPDQTRSLAIATDMRDISQIEHMFAQIRETWGGVNVLINNAGLGHNAPLLSGDPEMWREMLDLNVLALCVCTKEAVADMRRMGDKGHVIHIGSMSGHRVPGGSGVYSATKFAVRSLTEGLRTELRGLSSAIRVGCISPGFVETEFAERYHKSAEKAAETYSRFKVLESKDIADAVLFLLNSPEHMQVHDVLIRPTAQPS